MARGLLPILAALFLAACTSATSQDRAVDARDAVDPSRDDVEAGAIAYRAQLEPYGTWDRDALDGAHWCPHDAELTPNPIDFSPYARRSLPAAWRDVTMTHGRWVHRDGGARPWCWVPGVAIHRPEIRERTAMRGSTEGAVDDGSAERVQRSVLRGIGEAASVASDVLDVIAALSRSR